MAEQKNQDLNQLLKIRRDKLAELQANGKDPFQITKFNQTHHSLEVKKLYEAHEAELLKDHNEPDAGTVVVVKAHFFHLTYLLVQYCMWRERKMELV